MNRLTIGALVTVAAASAIASSGLPGKDVTVGTGSSMQDREKPGALRGPVVKPRVPVRG